METPHAAPDESWGPRDQLRARESDDLDEALRRLLNVASDLRPTLADRLELAPVELWAIEHVMAERMGPVELARRLGLTSAAATMLVRRLELRGHLDRSPHPQDGRRIELRATPHAWRSVVGVLLPLLDRLQSPRADFSQQERDVVTRYLLAVSEELEGYLRESVEVSVDESVEESVGESVEEADA